MTPIYCPTCYCPRNDDTHAHHEPKDCPSPMAHSITRGKYKLN